MEPQPIVPRPCLIAGLSAKRKIKQWHVFASHLYAVEKVIVAEACKWVLLSAQLQNL